MARPVVCLAPMDGITDTAYRRVVRGLNPSVVFFSEFTSADGFLRSSKVRERLAFRAEERPYFVQLFGNNPQSFREAARTLEGEGVTGIDINMGCPARKIVASQHGSGLMRDVHQACRIVEAVAGACGLEVSVKTRLGWSSAERLVPFAQALVGAGASLIAIHGRTYDQGFGGAADWAPIHALKSELPVPVLGNGDVADLEDGLARMGALDGFMIGRAAIGNPWVFLPRARRQALTLGDRVAVMIRHLHLMVETRPERRAVLEFRKHLVGYLKGFPHAKAARCTLLAVDQAAELERLLEGLAAGSAPLAKAG